MRQRRYTDGTVRLGRSRLRQAEKIEHHPLTCGIEREALQPVLGIKEATHQDLDQCNTQLRLCLDPCLDLVTAPRHQCRLLERCCLLEMVCVLAQEGALSEKLMLAKNSDDGFRAMLKGGHFYPAAEDQRQPGRGVPIVVDNLVPVILDNAALDEVRQWIFELGRRFLTNVNHRRNELSYQGESYHELGHLLLPRWYRLNLEYHGRAPNP